MNSSNEWLLIEILTGIQKLSCLSLDRTPATEVLEGTARTWFESLTHNRQWDSERDAERVASAFMTLAARSKRWPCPAEFLESLPPAVPLLQIAREKKPASQEVRNAALRRLKTMLEGLQ